MTVALCAALRSGSTGVRDYARRVMQNNFAILKGYMSGACTILVAGSVEPQNGNTKGMDCA